MPSTRRQFLAQAAAPAFLAGQAADRPPNIVSIVCDQMRGDCMGNAGHPHVRTPSLDRMAREGVTFDRAFVNGPVCVPSRKSCFSGLYPHQHGSLTNSQKPLLSWSGTMLEQLQRSGYRTGWVGKNHTYTDEAMENVDFKSIRSREKFRAYNGMVPPHWHTDVYWPEEDCFPEINTREAFRFLEETPSNDPFFLHVSYFDPHPPYMAPSDFSRNYPSDKMTLPEYRDPATLSPRLAEFKRGFGLDYVTRAELTETSRYYYAQVEWGVDKQVGRILDYLQARGMDDNTIVVFTSDHGDFMGSYGMVRKGMFLYDALLHVPMIWWAPGRFPRGLRTSAFAQHTDLFPTFADFSGKRAAGDLPGQSLRPFIERGERDDPERMIFTSAGYGEMTDDVFNLPRNPSDEDATPRHSQALDQNMEPDHRTSMLRTQEWKLIMNENRGPELYHMNGGVVESANLADRPEHKRVRASLENSLGGWWSW